MDRLPVVDQQRKGSATNARASVQPAIEAQQRRRAGSGDAFKTLHVQQPAGSCGLSRPGTGHSGAERNANRPANHVSFDECRVRRARAGGVTTLPCPVAEAGTIDFELARFEHLVETQRGHIVRVTGTWSTPTPRELPHPTLVAGEGEDAVSVAPLPIPGQDPPRADGESPWVATYSIPKRLFTDGRPPACRLQPAPDVLVDLPELELPVPAADGGPAVLIPRPPGPLPRMPPSAPPDPAAAARTAAPSRPAKTVGELFVPAVRSHRRLAAAIVAVAVAGSLLGLAIRSPSYETAARLLITPLPRGDTTLQGLPEVRAGSDPAQTVLTVARLLESREAAADVARRLGRGWTVRRVLNRVDVTPRGQSNVLDVRATADDAKLAARLANLFVQTTLAVRNRHLAQLAAGALAGSQADLRALPDQGGAEAQAVRTRIAALQRIQANGDPTLDVLQNAAVPRSPAGLPPPAIVALTTLAGLLLAVGAAALLDLLGPGRINEERDIRALYPLPVLTRLPTLPRRRRTADAPELREAFRTLQVQLDLEPGRHRVVMVTSASTGDGKTTSALGFALELTAGGRQVILIDLDLRKPDLAGRLGVRPTRGIEHLVAGRAPLADALVAVPGAGALELLAPAGQSDLSTLEAVAGQLPDIIDGATALADYVVLDTPPVGEVSDALKFARSVDDVLVVCRLGRTPRPSFEAMRDVLERVGTRPSGLIVIGGAGAAAARYPLATGESLRP